MSIRNIGKKFEGNGVRLWLHPSTPFQAGLVQEKIAKSKLGEDLLYVTVEGTKYLTVWHQIFADFEGYVLDIEADSPESAMLYYWQHRHECPSIEARFELMMSIFSTDDYRLLREAYKATRANVPPIVVPEGEKKANTSSAESANANTKAS